VLGGWGAPQGKQQKGKGKAKAGSGGAGGGPSTKAAAGSSGQGSSSQGSSRPRAPPGRIIGLRTEEAVQAGLPLAAEAASAAQQTEPQPGTKKDKERQRKERQRQRKMDEAREALQGATELMDEPVGSVKAVEEAMTEAEKHASRSEQLAALVAEAKGLIEQARAAEAERARLAAEVEAAAAAVAAAERLRLEAQLATLLRMQTDALMAQPMQAQLGVPPAAPAPDWRGAVRGVPGRAQGPRQTPVRVQGAPNN
jgi:hypothetical protein